MVGGSCGRSSLDPTMTPLYHLVADFITAWIAVIIFGVDSMGQILVNIADCIYLLLLFPISILRYLAAVSRPYGRAADAVFRNTDILPLIIGFVQEQFRRERFEAQLVWPYNPYDFEDVGDSYEDGLSDGQCIHGSYGGCDMCD